jgi:hypothetical protein
LNIISARPYTNARTHLAGAVLHDPAEPGRKQSQATSAPASNSGGNSRKLSLYLAKAWFGNRNEVVFMKGEMNRYKAPLIAKHEEILGRSRHRKDIWIVESNDLIETVQLASDREFVVRTLERESKSLMRVDAALKRIDHGESGICSYYLEGP